jgi:hypothetical protein
MLTQPTGKALQIRTPCKNSNMKITRQTEIKILVQLLLKTQKYLNPFHLKLSSTLVLKPSEVTIFHEEDFKFFILLLHTT